MSRASTYKNHRHHRVGNAAIAYLAGLMGHESRGDA